MPAKSKAQQRFFGMVRAAQKGEMDNPSSEVLDAADSMKVDDVKKFAKTKHKGLPEKKKIEEVWGAVAKVAMGAAKGAIKQKAKQVVKQKAVKVAQGAIPQPNRDQQNESKGTAELAAIKLRDKKACAVCGSLTHVTGQCPKKEHGSVNEGIGVALGALAGGAVAAAGGVVAGGVKAAGSIAAAGQDAAGQNRAAAIRNKARTNVAKKQAKDIEAEGGVTEGVGRMIGTVAGTVAKAAKAVNREVLPIKHAKNLEQEVKKGYEESKPKEVKKKINKKRNILQKGIGKVARAVSSKTDKIASKMGEEFTNEGVVDVIKKGSKRHKDAVEKKKIKNRKAVPYAALAAEHTPEGEVLDERQKTNQGERQSQEAGRSDYGKMSVRNKRKFGKAGEPAVFDLPFSGGPSERGKMITQRRTEHKAKRGVKTKGVTEDYYRGTGEKVQSRTLAWMRKKGMKGSPGLNAMKAREAEHKAKRGVKEDWKPEIEHSKLGDAKKKADKKRESKLPPHLQGDAIGKMKKAFSQEGYRVLASSDGQEKPSQFSYKDEKTAKKYVDSIKKGGGKATVVKEDIGSFKEYMANVDAAKKRQKDKQENRKKKSDAYIDRVRKGIKFYDAKGSGRMVKGKKVYDKK